MFLLSSANSPLNMWPSFRCWIADAKQLRSDESVYWSSHPFSHPRRELLNRWTRWWWLYRRIASTIRNPCDRWGSGNESGKLAMTNRVQLASVKLTLLHCSVWRSQILIVLSRRPETILLSSYWRQYTPLEFSERQLIRCKLWLPERQLFSIVSMSCESNRNVTLNKHSSDNHGHRLTFIMTGYSCR